MDKFEIFLLVFAIWNFLGFIIWALAGITCTNGPEVMISPNSLKRYFYTDLSYPMCWVLAILLNLACPLMFLFTFIYWIYDLIRDRYQNGKKK